MESEYKAIDVADGAISSLLLGEARIETPFDWDNSIVFS